MAKLFQILTSEIVIDSEAGKFFSGGEWFCLNRGADPASRYPGEHGLSDSRFERSEVSGKADRDVCLFPVHRAELNSIGHTVVGVFASTETCHAAHGIKIGAVKPK